jgi:large subunit ribosomal protein L23
MDKHVVLIPRMSEKAYGASQSQNTYVFEVSKDLNKHSIASAVAAQFNVTVEDVNVVVLKGKTKRTVTKGGRKSLKGTQNDVKKAYVRLKEGDNLPIFAAVEEATEKAERKQELAEKAAEKRAKDAAKEAKKGKK